MPAMLDTKSKPSWVLTLNGTVILKDSSIGLIQFAEHFAKERGMSWDVPPNAEPGAVLMGAQQFLKMYGYSFLYSPMIYLERGFHHATGAALFE